MPLASTILMVRPAAFGFNPETAVNNYFQSEPGSDKEDPDSEGLQQKALAEFDRMVETLQSKGIDVLVINDTETPAKPDAVFPNNWLSTSPTGVVSLFPLYAPNRRTEK